MKGGFNLKNILITIGCLLIIFCISNNSNNSKIIIPKESIRFRVIANSNQEKDQENKLKIATNLEKNIMSLLKDTNSLESTRMTLKGNINNFKTNIDKTMQENNIDESYTIDYGNHYFPEKSYKGVQYKAGNYESLVVTLGNGKGENFWCVLFPPLCLLEAEETDKDEVEYTSFIKEVIDKYFS